MESTEKKKCYTYEVQKMIWSQKLRDDWLLHYTFKEAILIYHWVTESNLDGPTRNTTRTTSVIYQSRSSVLVFNSKFVAFMNNGLSPKNY